MSVEAGATAQASTGRGHFFAVDWRCIEAVCGRPEGLNAAVAYLVLARFASGKNHSSTRAGATALHVKLGLSRGRADAALKHLENAGFMSQAGRGGIRKLFGWGEMQAEVAGLTEKQRVVLARVKGRKDPITSGTDPDYQTAYALTRKGALALANGAAGKPKFKLPEPDYIFLPNALVDGFREGDAPLARLRQIGDSRAVNTLMRVYREANLPEDGGVPPTMIQQTFERFEAARWGDFTVWAFVRKSFKASIHPFVALFTAGHPSDQQERLEGEFWRTWFALMTARLIEHVGYIAESEDHGAQLIHPFDISHGTEEERRVSEAAALAGSRMISEAQAGRATKALGRGEPFFCPVRSHVLGAHLIGVCRPVYRANTSRTRAWARNYLHQCDGHAALFADLAQSRTRTTA